MLLDDNQVQMFYTAAGHDNGGVNPNDPLQRLATASGRIHADNSHVWLTGFTNHKVIAEPDGRLYQTLEQSLAGPIIYAFRDPWVFRNPADGKVYLLFEGNTGGTAGAYQCNPRDIGPVPPGHVVPPDSRFFTGNIGLAQAITGNLRQRPGAVRRDVGADPEAHRPGCQHVHDGRLRVRVHSRDPLTPRTGLKASAGSAEPADARC